METLRLEHDWVMKPIVEFESTDDLLRLMPERVINVAEARVASRRQKLAELLEGDRNVTPARS